MISVNTGALRALAAALDALGTEVAELSGTLAGSAGAPESPLVIGSQRAGFQYGQALSAWTRSLSQLSGAFTGLGQQTAFAAGYYEQTEAANTITQAP